MEFGKLKVTELRKQLGDLGLDTTGLKADLVERLTSYTDLPADTTYKLLYQRYPVLMAGLTLTKHEPIMHSASQCAQTSEPLRTSSYSRPSNAVLMRCLAIPTYHTYHTIPTYTLVADAADATTNAFKVAFGETSLKRRVMCWFHMKKAFEGRDPQSNSPFKQLEADFQKQIKKDICTR